MASTKAQERTAQLPAARLPDWIDPFCPLLSDRIGVRPGDPPRPVNAAAVRTARALEHFAITRIAGLPVALKDGAPATLDEALAAAAGMLSSWRQPLFGGLGTDVAGARALTRLAIRCGAILDHAHGESMTQALRALQDRGGFTCTLSEVRNRADLVVCIGVDPASASPDFFQRCGFGEAVPDTPAQRQVVFLGFEGREVAGERGGSLRGLPGVQFETLTLKTELHAVLAELNAACGGRKLPRAGKDWPALQALSRRLLDARYAVLVHAPSELVDCGHAALLIEGIHGVIRTLNRSTRAAALALGSADGSATVSQAATWLTGLPLRSALHAHGFEHDPCRFGTDRLLASGAADGLLWVSSFSPELLPPTAGQPTPLVVLGHPAMASRFLHGPAEGENQASRFAGVFIAVATPGVNAPGHLFRGDGGVVLALKPFTTTALPGVDEVARRLLALLQKAS